MSEKPIIEFRDLKQYFKYAPMESSNSSPSSTPQPAQANSSAFYTAELNLNAVFNSSYDLETEYIKQDRDKEEKERAKEEKNNAKLMKVIDGVNLTIPEGTNMSIIGESGCGKTTLLLSLLNLPRPELQYISGQILYDTPVGQIDLLSLSEKQMRKLRGTHFGFIPQLAKASIDPFLKLGFQTGEILQEHFSEKQQIIKAKVIEYLGKVAFPDPGMNVKKYVHQISGGEAQKVVIAMALIGNPRILLADEIFSGIDVITQSQITALLKDLHELLPFQFIFTTHNIAAALNLTEVIAIMYAGEIVEVTTGSKFMEEPLHPYSQGILRAIPWYAMRKGIELDGIPGEPPNAFVWPTGCRFSPRCSKAVARCSQEKPPFFQVDERKVACWLYSDDIDTFKYKYR